MASCGLAGQSLVLKPWTPRFKFTLDVMCKVPIWDSSTLISPSGLLMD